MTVLSVFRGFAYVPPDIPEKLTFHVPSHSQREASVSMNDPSRPYGIDAMELFDLDAAWYPYTVICISGTLSHNGHFPQSFRNSFIAPNSTTPPAPACQRERIFSPQGEQTTIPCQDLAVPQSV